MVFTKNIHVEDIIMQLKYHQSNEINLKSKLFLNMLNFYLATVLSRIA